MVLCGCNASVLGPESDIFFFSFNFESKAEMIALFIYLTTGTIIK